MSDDTITTLDDVQVADALAPITTRSATAITITGATATERIDLDPTTGAVTITVTFNGPVAFEPFNFVHFGTTSMIAIWDPKQDPAGRPST